MVSVELFAERHIEEAACLFTSAYRHLRASISLLPCCHEAPAAIMPLLSDMVAHHSGVVAIADGQMVGYLCGIQIPEFKSPYPGVYCPEWANAVVPGREDDVYTALFSRISPYWAHAGAVSFAVTVLAMNQSAINVWNWNGFGLAVIDAICPPGPIGISAPKDLLIRRATSDDLMAITSLLNDHNRYMQTPPVSLLVSNDISADSILNKINRSDHAIWIAEMHEETVGLLEAAGSVSGASHIVSGDRGIGIKCAHVLPKWRGQGIATALLNTAFTWARAQGIERCSVDFESFNPTARRFWLRYFTPVCFSLVRRFDERSIRESQQPVNDHLALSPFCARNQATRSM